MLFLIFLMPAQAMTASPSPAIVNSTLIVSGLPAGANVQFILNGGVPVFAVAGADGTASYLPLFKGSLEIIVMQGRVVIERTTVPVLAAAAPGTAATSTSVPGGGSGGGGMTAQEPNENIEKTERIEKSLISNIPIIYNFTVPGIYQIVVTGADNENLVSIKVEALKATSKLAAADAPGIIYMNLNVWAGTKRIKKAVIKFRVESSWMQGKSLAGSDMKMFRWNGSKWVQLETRETGKDSTHTSFEATTDALSNLAITGLKGEAAAPTSGAPGVPGVTATAVKPETTAPPVSAQKAAGFEIVPAIAALWMFYMIRRR